MVRISLKEAYDDRSVIKKIADLEANKQDKLTAGQNVSIDNNMISVDTSNLATKGELTAETARLDTRIDDVDAKIPPLASKEELSDEVTRLDAKIETGDRDLSSRIDASNVKIKANADAILTIEGELGSDALPGTLYYRITKVEGEVITLKPLVKDSINKVDVEGDASTVYHRALHNSGIVENDALPVASDTKAGVMSAGMYIGFNSSIQNLQARMAVLEGVGITYQLTGLPDNPSDAQITAAFREQYPNVPLMAGIRVADYDKAKIWQYSGAAWIQLTSLNLDKATSTSLGVVKGSETSTTNEGKIFVEVDGTMAVIGWDTLKALATAAKQSVDNLESKVTQQSAKIDALEEDVATNAADITALQGTSTDHESRISSLETTSANLGTRMSSAETDIDTLQSSDAQQTSKISALEADMNNVKPRVGQLESDVGALETKINQTTQSISGLSTEVNGLKTSKQDKLTAGPGISIVDSVISSEAVQISRKIVGSDTILREFVDYLNKAEVGDTFHTLYAFSDSGFTKYVSPSAVNPNFAPFALGGNNGVILHPYTAMRMIDKSTNSAGDVLRTFEYIGAYETKAGSSIVYSMGQCWLTVYENAQKYALLSARIGQDTVGNARIATATGEVTWHPNQFINLPDLHALVNYNPRT